MENIYKQTANLFNMDEYLSAYRTKPTENSPSLQILLEDLGYNFARDDNNNIIGMQKSPDHNLPKLTSILDAYRHAAFSAIEAKDILGPVLSVAFLNAFLNAGFV